MMQCGIRKTRGDRIFDAINIFVMILLMVVVILPMFSVVSTSLVSSEEIAKRRFILFPEKISFDAYKALVQSSSNLINGYKVTLFRVFICGGVNLLFTYFVGYALAKDDLVGRTQLTFFFFFTMLFSGGLIPTYIIVKTVGLLNNIWVYLFTGIISVWNTLLMRNFIAAIPKSLCESASIDGAGDVTIIFRVILPLSLPALVTIGLFYGVAHWNAWWDAYIYVHKGVLQPVQLVLRNILARVTLTGNDITGGINSVEMLPPSRSMQNACVVLTTLPIVCVYPFLQRFFIKGVLVGAVKG